MFTGFIIGLSIWSIVAITQLKKLATKKGTLELSRMLISTALVLAILGFLISKIF